MENSQFTNSGRSYNTVSLLLLNTIPPENLPDPNNLAIVDSFLKAAPGGPTTTGGDIAGNVRFVSTGDSIRRLRLEKY